MSYGVVLESGDSRGRLTKMVTLSGPGKKRSIFICDCGRAHIAEDSHVVCGYTRSCGCAQRTIRKQMTVYSLLKAGRI